MDALRKQKFNQAMFSKNRTLAIRVGKYQSSDIKEASFDYGYIKGDAYKPGGTCAGSAKIVFTSIITTFNKLDKVYPEVGLLVDGTYEWVKMGEYFINDIEIDRNRNTTKLDLMDGMFKLNREHVTDLSYPAEIRHVIKEICLKTGITLANEYMDITSMNYRIEHIPKDKKMTFRDVLSLASQMLGMSCFFNREGKLEVKELTDSGIVITADSYFMHGLTKSEIEYQIAGITCKKDKEILTVGLRTGRSLEIENLLMSQSALDNLYHNIKDICYYPFNLNYQGHLLLDVGQWVTIKTNTGETFKSPVLSQSFTFKGGLRGRISADSKTGNDAQYSYAGTITKKIEQFNEIEAQIQSQLEEADKGFDRKKEELVNQFQDGMGAAYSKAEEVRTELLDTIDQRFSDFDNGPLQEVNRRAEEALQNAGASSLLALEAKQIGLGSIAKLEEFRRQTFNTQSALSGAIDTLKWTVTNDIRPKQAQAEAEIAKQVEALNRTKNELAGVKSAQAIYEESTTHRLSELTNLANGKASKSELTQTAEVLASKIASVQVAHKNQGDRVSAVESNFKQRADSLETGVSRLTEGLRTKADISSLNVTAENIRQSVKSLETSTQNKLNQKLNLAEFEVRAGSIRQEILNATKDKADKTLVVAEAGKLREEFSKMKVGGRNYAEDYDFSRGLWIYSQGDNSPQDWTILNGEYNVKGTTNTYKQMQIHSREGSRSSWKSSTALLELEVGETYTLSFQGICYSGSPKVWVSLRANRTVPGNPEIINGNFNLTPSWQTYQVTIPALTKPDDFDFWRIILGYNEIGHVAFRKVELTRSSTRIDAGPAPEDGKTDLVVAKSEFQKTAEGLRTDMSAIQEHVNKEGQRQEVLRRYTREESAQQANAVRELVARNYVGKSDYQEDVKGLERRFSAISTQTNNDIATKIAQYKQTVDGRFADISSLISGKANQTDFQRVQETSKLYERIIGSNENDISNKVARMALTNQLFQIEVSKNEGLKTVQRQIAGSWAVQNINSEGDLISEINLGANGYNRFDGKLTHITGETLIDKAVIKSAMVDKLKTANFEAGSVTTVVLDAEAVTAEKLKVDQAFFNKLVANEAYLNQLFAKQAFINRVQSISINASQVKAGFLSGDRILGGTITGSNIYGGTLTGHTQIQLGTYGSFDTVNGGIQINVPREPDTKDGLGVQFIGSYGRGENVPYGLFIYKDSDFTVGGAAETSDGFLLTVEGYIQAKGIGWLKTGKGSVSGKTTGTIGFWDSNNVSLSFGGLDNDIYYSYNSKAYSLWSVVDQHFSDRRLKENIVDCKHKALDYIQQFQFKEYDWKKQEDRPQKAHTRIGLIAQEVQTVDPTLVYENGDTLNLDNLRLTSIALKAIQELSQRIETLERKLA